MKENGIEKLIELLNEFGKKVKKSDREWSVDNEGDIFQWVEEPVDGNRYEHYFPTPILISKSFGFIKWLVDNDKIEASEIMLDDRMGTIYDKTDSTLMMLAIQDNPISFICDILK